MTEEKRWTFQDTIKSAREEMRGFLEDCPDADIHELAGEVADTHTPVYTYDLLMMAAEDDLYLATTESEHSPAFDGSPTPANILAANIYDRIYEAVMEEAHIFEQEKEE